MHCANPSSAVKSFPLNSPNPQLLIITLCYFAMIAYENQSSLGKLSKLKSWETLDWVQSGNGPPHPFFELGIFLKRNDPLIFFWNKLIMKNIGTKSIIISDIMVYLAMFSTTIDNILCFLVLIIWKWVIILLVFGTLWNLGLFWFPKTPPLILNFSQLKLGTFLIFGRPPPYLD